MKHLVAFGCLILVIRCEGLDRSRQVRTFADLQSISARLDRLREEDRLTTESASAALNEVADGKDAWGNKLHFRLRTDNRRKEYVVASFGADGKCDVKNIDMYFTAAPERVSGMPNRDIVFRDGEPILNAGK